MRDPNINYRFKLILQYNFLYIESRNIEYIRVMQHEKAKTKEVFEALLLAVEL